MRQEIHFEFKRKFNLWTCLRMALLGPIILILGITQADYVELALGATETTETKLGTITVPASGISRIVGVYGIIHGVQTTGEENTGYFRLQFGTVPGVFKFPASVFLAGAGTLAGGTAMFEPKVIPVNITVPAKETIDAYVATFVAATGATRGMVGVIME